MSNRELSFICIQNAAAGAAAALCCYTAVVAAAAVLLQLLLLFVIVCRMAKFSAGSLSLIPVFSLSSFKHDLFWMYPLAVPRRVYGLDLHTSSVGTSMCEAKAGEAP